MPVEIRVPQLGESIVEATITKWLKKEGEPVNMGDAIVELETDKVNVEVPADLNGMLEKISRQEGETVNIGDVLGLISETSNGQAAAEFAPGAEKPAETPATAPSSRNGEAAASGSELGATPLARRIAEGNNVDIRAVKGTGPAGQVTKDDVDLYLKAKPAAPAAQTPPAPAAPQAPPAAPAAAAVAPRLETAAHGRPEERIKMSRRRLTIAARLVEAQQTAAMLTTFNEVDMSAIMAMRTRRKDAFKERYGVGLGFMSFFTKATIGALKAFPLLNAEIQGTEIVKKLYYDIGIAVGADEGLVVPVVRDADRKTFAEIEKAIGDLAKRARENKLTLAELQGGTFTITNGGTFGSLMSTPILNAPQVGILGMHKIEERPVVKDGAIVIRPMMYLALSYDHRIVDGSEAVKALVRIKQLLEDPESLLIEG